MIVKLLTEYHLKFLSLTGGCRGSSASTLVKMSNCWKSHATDVLKYIPTGIKPALDSSTRNKNIRKHANFPCNRKRKLGQR